MWARAACIAIVALLGAGATGCDDEGSGAGTTGDGDARLRDLAQDDTGTGGEDAGATDAPSGDTGGPDGTEDPVVVTDAPVDGTGDDGGAAEETSQLPGPDNLLVGCITDAECPADGADPGVCCTDALRYESYCSTLAECGAGRRDACLTDDQCSARRPGEWTTCCHDRGLYHFCAPGEDTCQPHEVCDQPSDCQGSPSEPCCTYHDYYQQTMCGGTFFAVDPDNECL